MTTQLVADDDKVSLSGSTMTGPLILPGNPVNPLGALPKQYADAGFTAVVRYSAGWPSRPASPAVVAWTGATATAPPIGGLTGAQPNDIWLQALVALVPYVLVSGAWTALSLTGSGTPPPPPPPAPTGRVGATMPSPVKSSIAAFPALAGQPLSAWRLELGGDPIPTTVAATPAKYLPSPQCRLILDLEPGANWAKGSGSLTADVAPLKSLLADMRSSSNILGFPVDAKISLFHEPSDGAGLTQLQFQTSLFPTYAQVIHDHSPYDVIYCLAGGEVVNKGILASWYPGDAYVDCIYPDAYINSGLAALAICAPFADAHNKLLGMCEFAVQDNAPSDNNYGTQAQNVAYLTAVYNFFLARWQAGKAVGDMTYFMDHHTGQGDFNLASNPYALTQSPPNYGWLQFYSTFNSFTGV